MSEGVDLHKVVDSLTYRRVPKHEAIFRYGESAGYFCILLNGLASAWVPVPELVFEKPLNNLISMLIDAFNEGNYEVPCLFTHSETFCKVLDID